MSMSSIYNLFNHIYMYYISLIINREIFIPLVLSGKDFAFNHAYIYIVNLFGFYKILV